MGVMNRSLGGFKGKSSGNVKRALKKPPSLHESGQKIAHIAFMLRHVLKGIRWAVGELVSRGGSGMDEGTYPMIMTSHSYRLLSSTSPFQREWCC